MWFLSKLAAILLAAGGVFVAAAGVLEGEGKLTGVGLVLLLGGFVFALIAFAARPKAPAGRP